VDNRYPSPVGSSFDEEYSWSNEQSPTVRRTGHQTFVSRVADKDDWTDDTEDESEESMERIVTPRSIYAVTATEPADFFEEYWQTQEYVGDRQFEDYDNWFCEDYNAYDADRDGNADNIDNHDDNAYDSYDEQVFCLGD
jgi:hypothetical protein